MLRNRGNRSAPGDDGVIRRPLAERDVNAEKQGFCAPAMKAKQSPAVNRQRDPGGESSCTSARSIGVLQIPKRLATAGQVQRTEHIKLPSKRPDLSHDAAVESPCKRFRRCEPGLSGGQDSLDQPSFVPVSLSLGGMAAPVVSGAAISARGRRAPLRAPPRSVQQTDTDERQEDGNSNFMAELKAKLRQREERKAGVSDIMGIGMKDIRDVFLNFLHTFKNFTSEILREEDDDSDEWEWAEQSTSPDLKKNAVAGDGATTPPDGSTAAWKPDADPWDDDPWFTQRDKKASMGARVSTVRMETSRMRGPCTPSSLLLEKRLSSPPGSRGKLSSITGKMNTLRQGRLSHGSSPHAYGDFLGGVDGGSGGRGGAGSRARRLRHSPGGGSSSPMLHSVYNALEERLMISPGGGAAASDALHAPAAKKQSASGGGGEAVKCKSAILPRKTTDAPKLLWNIQQVRWGNLMRVCAVCEIEADMLGNEAGRHGRHAAFEKRECSSNSSARRGAWLP